MLVKDARCEIHSRARLVIVTLSQLRSNRARTHSTVLVLSAHADAFNAARRRTYTEALIDWAEARVLIV